MDADLLDIFEYVKSKGFNIKKTDTLGYTTFVELTPNEDTRKKRINEYVTHYPKFFKEILQIDVRDSVQYGINKIWHHDKVLVGGERQSGKTTLSVISAIVPAIFDGKRVDMIAPNRDMVIALSGVLSRYLEKIPNWLSLRVTSSLYRHTFENGGSINIGVAGGGCARGIRPDVLILDEFSSWDKKEQIDFWHSIYPIVSYSGDKEAHVKLIITGSDTPDENLFNCLVIDSDRGMNPFVSHRLL